MKSRPLDARALALHVLLRVERQAAYLNLALSAALAGAGAIDRRDAALCTELCYGVYRRLLALDAALQANADRSLSKIEAVVLAALRLGAYQLLYLDKIPARAAVDESVRLVKDAGKGRAAGFVNAVLRALERQRSVPLPDPEKDLAGHLSIRESHPRWLVERWIARLGAKEAEALCAADNRAPAVDVRVNARKGTREQVAEALRGDGVGTKPTAYSPIGLALEEPGRVERLGSFARGLWQVQDEAAQCVGLLVRPAGAHALLDACAAPGGKACHLLEQMDAGAKLLAIDLHEHKLSKIREEATRLGLEAALEVRAQDATLSPPGAFDRILVDAPCTGLGTLRRHPELRYRRAPEDIGRLAALQARILGNVAGALKPGGLLVYAVCSTAPEEGVEQVERLLAEARGLERAEPEGIPDSVRPLLSGAGDLATWPHRHGMDGFYAAALRRVH